MDGFDGEGFPTGLGAWLPAPRRPHPSEVLPPRVVPPRRGGAAYVPAYRPHLGLSVPPPQPLVRRPAARTDATRAALLLGLSAASALPVLLMVAPPSPLPVRLAAFVALLAAFGEAAQRVSYRRRDALLLLVPVLSLFVFVQILWRVTALPDRPWRPRVDELAGPAAPSAYRDGPDPWERRPKIG